MEAEDFLLGLFIGMLISLVVMVISTIPNPNTTTVKLTTLDAVCKDKIPNTEFKQIDEDGNIVCKELPEMQRLDHTNQFIYTDNGDK